MVNLTSIIIKGVWDSSKQIGSKGNCRLAMVYVDDECILHIDPTEDEKTATDTASSIAQLPKLLGLVDVLQQRLEIKYKGVDITEIPSDEAAELIACRSIRKSILEK